ncbi:hypothetical protein QOZ96_002644 [Brevundimonas nasdae]|uniref:nucleotidyltransferase domain-containing protein n=1 Tax=Brevundimonas nasdae TaxID=172043 RepID=UPI0019134168|nr:nucleotidyltransferase domain-containing protein [Brevundimonas nasdae]MBK6025861.1 nucleotidyltransferase domain-containing protein [Brevundimonas nasdae]MDQ0452691.1 hypothetical protein [Brevundimonas nasdae]
MQLPENICGHAPLEIRDAFKAFLDLPTAYDWSGSFPTVTPKRMTPEFLSGRLAICTAEATSLITCFTSEGWLEPGTAVPTTKGMSLAQHIVRPRLPRDEADEIFDAILSWAETHNEAAVGDIRIKSLFLYGSYLTGDGDVGDIDLIVVTNEEDLTDQGLLQPEHEDEVAAAVSALEAISEYISPATPLDMLKMPDATFHRVYKWHG